MAEITITVPARYAGVVCENVATARMAALDDTRLADEYEWDESSTRRTFENLNNWEALAQQCRRPGALRLTGHPNRIREIVQSAMHSLVDGLAATVERSELDVAEMREIAKGLRPLMVLYERIEEQISQQVTIDVDRFIAEAA